MKEIENTSAVEDVGSREQGNIQAHGKPNICDDNYTLNAWYNRNNKRKQKVTGQRNNREKSAHKISKRQKQTG